MSGTHLDWALPNLGSRHLIVYGVTTSGRVESTVRDAADLGWHVPLPEDCRAAISKQLHDNTINAMRLVVALVKTADQIVDHTQAGRPARV